METAVVGHTEWITFADVDAVPPAGGIAHTTDEWETPGGGGAVAAVQLAKLSGSATFFTAIGDDDIGARTQRELTSMGVDVRAATRRDTRSRRALTLIDPAGERTIVTLGDRLAPAAADPLGWDDLGTTDTVYVTAGDPGALAHAREASCMVVTSRILRELLATDVVPDVLVGSARDPNEAVRTDLLPWRPRLIVRTEGVRGGAFETADGITHRWEPAPVTPGGDTYGAGDSFAAGLTFALGQGREPADAVRFAARCGAACASGRGPYAGQLTAADH
jgi:ribokinase